MSYLRPHGQADQPWTLELLLSTQGMRAPHLSIRQVRRLVIQEDSLIYTFGQAEETALMGQHILHAQLCLENPFVDVAVRTILYDFCNDTPELPEWDQFAEPVQGYLAYLAARTFLQVVEGFEGLPGEAGLAERQAIIIHQVRTTVRQTREVLQTHHAAALRNFRFVPATTNSGTGDLGFSAVPT